MNPATPDGAREARFYDAFQTSDGTEVTVQPNPAFGEGPAETVSLYTVRDYRVTWPTLSRADAVRLIDALQKFVRGA